MRFLIRLLINAAALWVAIRLVPGILYEGGALDLLLVALVFGLLNAVIRPILSVLTCPLQLLTLGLFTLVLNGVMLWLTSVVARSVGLDFVVEGIWPNRDFEGGVGINALTSADPGPPLGGAVFHDTAIWVRKA